MIYRNSKGKFISKEEWLSLQPKQNKQMSNNKRKRTKKQVQPIIQEEALNPKFVETINKIEESLDKTEEWVGESGFYSSVGNKEEVKEGTQVVELGSDYDVDTSYKQEVVELEQSIEEAFNVLQDKVIQEKLKEPIKTPGFFTTWFKKWKW